MGDLDVGSFQPIVGGAAADARSRSRCSRCCPSSLNLLSVGADLAATRGVDVARAQRLAFLSASLATAAAVSLAGPIGFIGIVVPHLVRLHGGCRPPHRAAGVGARSAPPFSSACDLVARTILAPIEVPVGVVTAMLGGPFFLWLLVRRRLAPSPRGPDRCGASASAAARIARVRAAQPEPGQPAASCRSCPAVTEMLFAIGAGPQVVAVSSYDEFPPEVKSLPRVGALLDPDVERILALRPDLVISYGSQTDLQAQLERARHSASSAIGTPGLDGHVPDDRARSGRPPDARPDADRLARTLVRSSTGCRARARQGTRPGRARCWCSSATRRHCASCT